MHSFFSFPLQETVTLQSFIDVLPSAIVVLLSGQTVKGWLAGHNTFHAGTLHIVDY